MSEGAIRVDVEAASELSLAMVENSVPLVARVSITNLGAEALSNLRVEMALLPDFSAKWTTHVSAIPPGGTFNVDDVPLAVDRERLVNQIERGSGELVMWVRAEGVDASLATRTKRVDVLAYNEWSRATVPQLLAAFVLPNHPAVAELLAQARGPLERATGNPAIDGYQARSPERVIAIAQAIYEAIQARDLTYSSAPASFEQTGQKIRTPEQLFGERLGTCLDISVLVAAALEQAGLHATIVLVEGHAFPGVWLEDFVNPEGYLDDAATFRKLVELGRMLVFDSSANVARPAVPFAEARRIAQRTLTDTPFAYAVDITGARKQHYRPLPVRVAGYAAAVEVPVVVPATGSSGAAGVPRISPETRSRPNAKTKHPRIEAWKQRLLDTSLRNRLLNFRDTKQSLDLLCPDLGAVEDALASGGELIFRGRPSLLGGDDPRSKKLLEARVADDALATFLRERLGKGELYTDHTSDQTSAKLTTIFRAAREAIEETGTNTLCLALGMLHWYESESSEQVRRAPIMLLPVTLTRHARSGGFTVQSTGDDARLNVTLFEKLRIDTGIELPELTELPLDQTGVDVPAVLDAVRNAILNLRRWEVKEELHLGLFSFAKFQMWADLDQNLDALLANPVITHLLSGKGDPYPNAGAFPEPNQLDAALSPKDLLCPLDADASQLAAVAAGADGKTFVLQGPPGTGKSQTITNLITHCVAQGKRVLFVAEKAAALEVVQRRLTQVGLGPYVLELHSHKSGKQQVLEQFRAALEAQPVGEPATWDASTKKLGEERAHLNAYVGALHAERAGGLSVFRALSRLDRLHDAPLVELPAACAEQAETFERLKAEVENLRHAVVALAPIGESPWHGCALPKWEIDLAARVTAAIDEVRARVDETERAGAALAAALGAGAPVSLEDVASLAAVGAVLAEAPPHGAVVEDATAWPKVEPEARELAKVTRTRADALASLRERYGDGLFALDLDGLAERWKKFMHAFFVIAWWCLRGAKKTLRAVAKDGRLASREQVATDLDQARTARELEQRLVTLDARGRDAFGPAWQAIDSDPAALERSLAWAGRLHGAIGGVRAGLLATRVSPRPELGALAADARAKLDAAQQSRAQLDGMLGSQPAAALDWAALRTRLERWRGDVHRLRDWHAFLSASRALAGAGCGALVDAAARGQIPAEQLPRSFERGVLQAWVRKTLAGEPILNTFNGEQHDRRVAAFAELDRAHLQDCRAVARARIAARAPSAATTATGGEMGLLQKELQKKRRHMPIRKLLGEIPALAARLKPCFLMSPMSVATYLDPRAAGFDLVVFDEASQIPTHDAIGVLARGKSAIVVGDSKQLPPTSFFQSGGDDDAPDDNDFEELESILDECIAGGLPERRLDWHYRSRHESLIAFSNFHYYRNRLNTFPSALEIGPGRGVTFRQVAGYYDKGSSRTNRAEAEAVVADIVARLRGPDAAKRSYGIVTFSQAQQQLVEDLLDRARAEHPDIESFFAADCAEPVIVKNLENIQGDERDVMIFSICYGPDQQDKASMNFGPLNRDGGERRLNVAVTRAREELVVYSTLLPERIDLTRTNAVGVKHLKTFLDYARRGPAAISEALAVAAKDRFDSPFEEQVCERLRGLGYTVHTQVGCAGYRLDMGICHPDEPGRYVLGVECDGAYYHSARSARERDRLRAQVLEGLGWRIHRVWSSDWWQAADREVQKLAAAIDRARKEAAPIKVAAAAPAAVPYPAPAPTTTSRASESSGPKASEPAAPPAPSEATAPMLGRSGPISVVVPYRIAKVAEDRRKPDDIHEEKYRKEVSDLLLRVVEVEAPLSLRVLARRVCPYFGIHRTTARLEERLRALLGSSAKLVDDVIWRLDQDPHTYTEVRVAPPEAKREAQEVPLEEVANAALSVLRGSIALEHDELVKLTAKTLGFARAASRVADHMASGIALLVTRGGVRRENDRVVLG